MLTQTSCTSKPGANVPTSNESIPSDSESGKDGGKSLTIIGTLTDEGVECRAMRDARSNVLYTLTGDLAGYKTGDRVRVTGTVAEISFCQQGTTISVTTISRG